MILKTDIKDEDLQQKFEAAFSSSSHSSTAAFLRHIIKAYLIKTAGKKKGERVEPQPESEADLENVEFTVSTPKFIRQALNKRASLYSLTPTAWIRSLIAANITHRPIMIKDQVDALRAANRELASIGRNLNQIAKAMNQAVDLKVRDRVNYQHIQELQAGIDLQRKELNQVIAQSNNVWRVK